MWIIIQKEIHQQLLSWRFVVSMLLVVILFAVSGFVFAAAYEHQVWEYSRETNKNLEAFQNEARRIYQVPEHYHEIWRRPNPLTLCAGGSERYLPNRVRSSAFLTKMPEIEGQRNFLLQLFCDTDWVFVISYMMSFVALVLTYNSVCGEKLDGTLRLMLSTPLARIRLLLGKYIASLLVLLLILMLGVLVCLIIVISSNAVTFSGAQCLQISGILIVSICYLSLFVWLSLWISSVTTQSVNSMALLLIFWTGMTLLVPSLGRSISEVITKIPSTREYRDGLREALEWTSKEFAAGKYGRNKDGSLPDPRGTNDNPVAESRFWEVYLTAIDQVHERQHNQLLGQAFQARSLAGLSPWVIYQRLAETLAGTGMRRSQHLVEQIRQYRDTLKEYVRDVDAEDPNSLHLLYGPDYMIDQFTVLSKRSVDFDTVPKFQEQSLPLERTLTLAIWDFGALVLFNVLLFIAAFVSFLRYDVR